MLLNAGKECMHLTLKLQSLEFYFCTLC